MPKYLLSRVIFALKLHKSVWPRVVTFCQRGSRGWAESDTWNLDTYLARVISETVASVESQQAGTPYAFAQRTDGAREWNAYLLQVAQAFREYAEFMSNPELCHADIGNKRYEQLVEGMKILFDHYGFISA